jgi:hypothetical protein
LRGGEILRGGEAPSFFNSPFQLIKTPIGTIIQAEEGEGGKYII